MSSTKTQRRRTQRASPSAEPRPAPAIRPVRGAAPIVGVLLAVLALSGGAYAIWSMYNADPPILAVQVVNTYPHDATAYTQGLVFDDGMLLEGTGRYGQSTLREVKLETGQTERQTPLHQSLFGEGITLMGDRIYQLTWKSKTGIVLRSPHLRAGQYVSLHGRRLGADA